MKNAIKKIAILGGTLSLLTVAASSAFAHGDEKHGTTGKKNTDCHDMHGNGHGAKTNGKTSAKTMKGCHDQDHKAHGHEEQSGHMPHEGHQTGGHMKGGKMMNGH